MPTPITCSEKVLTLTVWERWEGIGLLTSCRGLKQGGNHSIPCDQHPACLLCLGCRARYVCFVEQGEAKHLAPGAFNKHGPEVRSPTAAAEERQEGRADPWQRQGVEDQGFAM